MHQCLSDLKNRYFLGTSDNDASALIDFKGKRSQVKDSEEWELDRTASAKSGIRFKTGERYTQANYRSTVE